MELATSIESMDIIAIVIIIAVIAIAMLLLYAYMRSGAKSVVVGGRRRKAKPVIRTPGDRDAAPTVLKEKDLIAHPRSRSEATIIGFIKEITGEKFPTVNPSWLTWKGRTLELDGYNEGLGVAMEFSGPLHTKWTPSFEKYERYFNRIVRDVVKRRICKRRGVHFFVVDASLPSRHWRAYVASRFYDFGVIKERPGDYIDEQIVSPFRNKQIEKELGLDVEWNAAKQL